MPHPANSFSFVLLAVSLIAWGPSPTEASPKRDKESRSSSPAPRGGALGRVTRGVRSRSGSGKDAQKGNRGGTRGKRGTARGKRTHRHDTDRQHRRSHTSHSYLRRSSCVGCVSAAPGLLVPSIRADLYLGLQNVSDSDGAFVGQMQLSHSGVGVSLSNSSYFEAVPASELSMTPGQDIRMHMLALALQARVAQAGDTELWLHGGAAQSRSNQFNTVSGIVFGARFEHQLREGLALTAGLRHFSLEEEVSATETLAGLRASIFTLSYRILDFNVGPPLHGPEAGVSLRF